MTAEGGRFAAPVLAANWKMNHGPRAAAAFMSSFLQAYTPRTDRTVVIIPSALALETARRSAHLRPDIRFGVQNVHTAEKGAFTGENSVAIAEDAGATFVLVGHSERRHVFGETDADTAKKCASVAVGGLTPILCIGETIEQREAGETDQVVLRQLAAGIADLSAEQKQAILIAYEPVWAIGTGKTATPDDAAQVHRVIRGALLKHCGDAGTEIPILYGGSVTPGNATSLLAAAEVGGVLVGGASLDAASWAAICCA